MVRKTVFRLIVLVLVAVLWLPLGRVSAEEGQSSRSLGVEELAAVIEEQVRVYAASINQSKADSNAAADLGGIVQNAVTVNLNAAFCHGKIAGDNVHYGRFTRTVGAKKANDLAIVDLEADVANGGVITVILI